MAVPVPGLEGLTYAVPPEQLGALAPGRRVWVPLGSRRVAGVVLEVPVDAPEGVELKEIAGLLDEAPLLSPELVALLSWAASYYQVEVGGVLRWMVPGAVEIAEERRLRITEAGRQALEGAPKRQQAALAYLAGKPQGALCGGKRRVGGPMARRLVELGWAQALEGGPEERVAAKTRWVYRAAEGAAGLAAELKGAPKQAATLAALEARGALTTDALEAEIPGAAAALRALMKKGAVTRSQEAIERAPESLGWEPSGPPPTPTPAQAAAHEALCAALGRFQPFLLHGVTGSGKTEVYLRLIEEALAQGRGALVLVPEIALTPQLLGRFRARFGEAVAVLHSALSEGERRDAWWRLQRGEARVALGVRSAVFAPVQDLGVIVVDEEHEGTFKQEEGLRYHARDLAVVRGRGVGAVVVLGSATPSMESLANAQAGRYRLLTLPERVSSRPLPAVEMIDLRHQLDALVPPAGPDAIEEALGDPAWQITPPLLQALQEVLSKREQAILFLNRRGHAPALIEQETGEPLRCEACDLSLTWHRRPPRLLCHYCGYERPVPRPGSPEAEGLRAVGAGTERVEDEVRARLPEARVLRLDRDSAGRRGALERTLAAFGRREADLLIGTQMVAKGHDFPGVTLVGVLMADQGLNVPDFRAAERTFQLVAQVAGRAGRGERPGRVLVQAFRPEHPAIALAARADYAAFSALELEARAQGRWPPRARLLMLRLDGVDPGRVAFAAKQLYQRCADAARRSPEAEVELLGPAPAPLTRLKGRTRWQILVKAPAPAGVSWLGEVARGAPLPPGVQLGLDVDPLGMM